MPLETISADWLLSAGQPPRAHATVVVDKDTGVIVSVTSEKKPVTPSEGKQRILTPGLINCHAHTELFSPEPLPILEHGTMADWLIAVATDAKAKTTSERLANCRRNILEMVRTGTTTVADISSDGLSAQAFAQVGMRAFLGIEGFAPSHQPDLQGYFERISAILSQYARHPLITIGLAPHSPYNVSVTAYKWLQEQFPDMMLQTHLAETQDELDWFLTGSSALDHVHEHFLGQRFGPEAIGQAPAEALKDVMTPQWLIAHGVFLASSHWEKLYQQGVSLAHCPRSNLWLSGQTVQIDSLPQPLSVGLGTDSRYSSPNLDLRAEARFAIEHHGVSIEQGFYWATRGGAMAVKTPKLGIIEPDALADLVIWEADDALSDPYTAWLHPDTRPQWVMINGRVVLEM